MGEARRRRLKLAEDQRRSAITDARDRLLAVHDTARVDGALAKLNEGAESLNVADWLVVAANVVATALALQPKELQASLLGGFALLTQDLLRMTDQQQEAEHG